MIATALLFALGFPGWFVFRALGVPSAPILGSMTLVGALCILGYSPQPPPEVLKLVLQVVMGMFIGLRVTGEIKRAFKGLMALSVVVSIYWLTTALATGFMLHALTSLNLPTALLGSTPGGVAEMSILAFSLGADPAGVALMQFFRLVLVLVLVPVLNPHLSRLLGTKAKTRQPHAAQVVVAGAYGGGNGGQELASESSLAAQSSLAVHDVDVVASAAQPAPSPQTDSVRSRAANKPLGAGHLRTLLLAVAGGGALHFLGFPAGGLVGAMIAVGVGRVLEWDCSGFPSNVRSFAQVGLGALIGLSFSPEMVSSLSRMALPVALLSAALFINGTLLAVFVHRYTGWDIRTCLISTSAGGVTQMSIVAEDMGADPVTVTLLHVVRLVTIVAVVPPVIKFMLLR